MRSGAGAVSPRRGDRGERQQRTEHRTPAPAASRQSVDLLCGHAANHQVPAVHANGARRGQEVEGELGSEAAARDVEVDCRTDPAFPVSCFADDPHATVASRRSGHRHQGFGADRLSLATALRVDHGDENAPLC